jgi:hypothetical protein
MKRVRFEDSTQLRKVVCEVENRSDISDEEYRSVWYSLDEYEKIKQYGKLLSAELRRSGRSHLLNGSLQTPSDSKISNGNDMDEVQQLLILWSRMGGFCRGLERWVNPSEGKQWKKLQLQSIQIVLDAQNLQRESSGEVCDESLRRISESYTAPSRIYARKMGIADAAASFFELGKSGKSQYAFSSSSMFEGNGKNRSHLRKVINCSPMA